ncbi:hypothetical protein WBO78_24155 [Bosea sp. CCNWLW174]|uniref:hypothetical protein n=1 Tax=unclassified Bosea (in: a-proteobacteria) TaxID=2653178 RepID=UPI0030144D18
MLTKVFIALVALSFAAPAAAETETERAVTSLYERFVAAQNARDTKAVRALMWVRRVSSGSAMARRSGAPTG